MVRAATGVHGPGARRARGIYVSASALAGLILLVGSLGGLALAAPAPVTCPNAGHGVGQSAHLPDCRAYEQVSPVDKGSYNAVAWNKLEQAQAAGDGGRVFYQGAAAFPNAAGNNAKVAGHFSVRTTTGWRTVELTPAAAESGPTGEYFVEYPAFSNALTQAVVKIPLALTSEANPRAWSVYVRDLASETSWISPLYSWINAVRLADPAAELCGGKPGEPSCERSVEFAGASQDFTHTLFETRTHLLPGAPATGVEELYERVDGNVRIVGVLPDGKVAPDGATGGSGTLTGYIGEPLYNADRRVEHAMSADGGRVVFQASADGGTSGEAGEAGLTELYDRIAGASTVELSAPAEGATPANGKAEPAEFWAASTDGFRVFFTSSAELTTASNTGSANEGRDLYEATLGDTRSGSTRISLRDLTADSTEPAGARVLGVVGVSEDGEYVYFVAETALVPGKGVEGEPNLYVERDGGKPIFIATLEPSTGERPRSVQQLGDSLDWTPYSLLQRAYVTPDGRHLAFVSVRKQATLGFPTGYDNSDIRTGEPDDEVYEYAAPSSEEEAKGETGAIVCISCDATGAPPTGDALIAGAGASTGEPITPTTASTPFHRVRTVSNNGARVFFSAPPFASEVVANSEETPALKIFEYEQGGEGSCAAGAGCVYRLSAANNPTPDLFLDASAGGEDVFFATYARLATSDTDGLIDVYDAREDGGFPSPTAATLSCGGGCHGTPEVQAEPPQIVTGVTGASGNFIAQPKASGKDKRKNAKPRRRHRLAVCRQAAGRHKSKQTRKRQLRRCTQRFGVRGQSAKGHTRRPRATGRRGR